ncbi:MAG TPA: hypothetical protein PLW99_02030 [Candidatus Paceibacterota bacterium]|nr:hypothetical protein [Candidatus Paceibacterota bacterium]
MSDIQFNEDDQYKRYAQPGRKPLLVRLVLRTGMVSTDENANYVLLGIVVAGFIIAGMLSFSGNGAKSLSNADIQRITQLQQGIPPTAP